MGGDRCSAFAHDKRPVAAFPFLANELLDQAGIIWIAKQLPEFFRFLKESGIK